MANESPRTGARTLAQQLAAELAKPEGLKLAREIIATQFRAAISSGNEADITRLAKLNELAGKAAASVQTSPKEAAPGSQVPKTR